MQRRDFLKWTGLGTMLASAPVAWWPGQAQATTTSKTLILVELKGGNDGLNTVVPYTDPDYYRLRPKLAIPKKEALPLSDSLGFNPALAPLMSAWEAEELAVISGVGYDKPNRSHFRSIDIWATASGADTFAQEGWVNAAARARGGVRGVEGVVIGRGDIGPLSGGDLRAVVMEQPEQFMRQAKRLKKHAQTGHAALDHVLRVQGELIDAADVLARQLKGAPEPSATFPRAPLGRQLELAARLLLADVPLTVIKVSHDGFDTHANQRRKHDRLLGQLAESLSAFRASMVSAGRWSDVLVMTYSEFGRRVAQNGSNGTDHGTAAPHIMLGGAVKGGLFGQQPSLDTKDLVHNVDYRSLYATVAKRWWGVDLARLEAFDERPLIGCL